ncbi:MAG: DUF6077 domain-containing protein [Butyrivibrio sp.]|nr:DUF6077 domain-containing protein [Acetatifactor muris]MCM1559879.1 DUF6077 domain-containing protein [Butyrivibrio sp.]
MVQTLILVLLLGVVPLFVGGLFMPAEERGAGSLPLRWVGGQMFLWAGFQVICVPLILGGQNHNFRRLCILFGCFLALALFLALVAAVRRRKSAGISPAEGQNRDRDKAALSLWLAVFGLFVLQLALAVTRAYEEGDDAFYVATAVITEKSDTMYQILPYTGFATGLDIRHGLAPFPVWAAFLARLSGVHAAIISQVVLSVALIAMAYSIYYLIGRELVGNSRRGLPLFMLLIEFLVIFGGQSLYTAENFLLVRTAQGKAVLAGIVIPFLFWLLLVLVKKLQRQEKTGFSYWLLFGVTMISGCLCSTQGALLVCLLAGTGGICAAAGCRSIKALLSVAACSVIPAVFMILYLVLG